MGTAPVSTDGQDCTTDQALRASEGVARPIMGSRAAADRLWCFQQKKPHHRHSKSMLVKWSFRRRLGRDASHSNSRRCPSDEVAAESAPAAHRSAISQLTVHKQVTVVTMLDQPELVPERLDTPSIIGTRVRAARWWLALILTDWAYELTRRETGDAPV